MQNYLDYLCFPLPGLYFKTQIFSCLQYKYKGDGSDDKSKKKKKKDKDSDAEDEPEEKKKDEIDKPGVSLHEQSTQSQPAEEERLVSRMRYFIVEFDLIFVKHIIFFYSMLFKSSYLLAGLF